MGREGRTRGGREGPEGVVDGDLRDGDGLRALVTRLALVDPGRSDSSVPLSLQWGSPDPLLASWRRLPVVGRLVPPPQRPHWGTLAVYRIRLHGQPGGFPGGDDAVFLDAAPG